MNTDIRKTHVSSNLSASACSVFMFMRLFTSVQRGYVIVYTRVYIVMKVKVFTFKKQINAEIWAQARAYAHQI